MNWQSYSAFGDVAMRMTHGYERYDGSTKRKRAGPENDGKRGLRSALVSPKSAKTRLVLRDFGLRSVAPTWFEHELMVSNGCNLIGTPLWVGKDFEEENHEFFQSLFKKIELTHIHRQKKKSRICQPYCKFLFFIIGILWKCFLQKFSGKKFIEVVCFSTRVRDQNFLERSFSDAFHKHTKYFRCRVKIALFFNYY